MIAPSLQPRPCAEYLLWKSLVPPVERVMKKKATANMTTRPRWRFTSIQ